MNDDQQEPTGFLAAKRLSQPEMKKESELFSENKLLVDLVNSISQMLVILNNERQTVYANRPYIDFCGFPNLESIIGKRPGEALNCKHTIVTKSECGTTQFCKTCGAANAIAESLRGQKSTKECRIPTETKGALDLRVTATPFNFNGKTLTVFTIIDISNEKRREALERVFFHDILNSAGGISGLSSIMKEVDDPVKIMEIAGTINRAAENLVDEIQTQHQLNAAERGELKPDFKTIDSLSIINDLVDLYSRHDLISDKTILVDKNSESVHLTTDPVLLRRILGNMIKNALEVYNPKAIITINCKSNANSTQFSVHNTSFIEPDIQLQLFNRSFSTKGTGRGLGTYSMKLLGEKYLKGTVWFESTREKGTTFFIEL